VLSLRGKEKKEKKSWEEILSPQQLAFRFMPPKTSSENSYKMYRSDRG
jgi:hypothetical protein